MLSRRQTIRLSAPAVAALTALGPFLARRASARRASTDPCIDWETFLVELEALTRAQHTPDWDPAVHVRSVTALLKELDVSDPTLQGFLDQERLRRTGFPRIHTAFDGGDYSVSVLQFRAGESIALHNHPRMTGAILCLAGSVEVEAFTPLQGLSKDGERRMRQELHTTLHPGDHATLTDPRGNIHALRAQTWCELLDVFTPPYTPDRSEDYRWYARSARPVEGDDIYAVWET